MVPQVPRSYKITFVSFREPEIIPSGQAEISLHTRKLCAHAKFKNRFYFNRHQNSSSASAELNPTCHLLALLGAHHILHVSRIRVKPYQLETIL